MGRICKKGDDRCLKVKATASELKEIEAVLVSISKEGNPGSELKSAGKKRVNT